MAALGDNARWLAPRQARRAQAGWWTYVVHRPVFDDDGRQVIDDDGQPVMDENPPMVIGGVA